MPGSWQESEIGLQAGLAIQPVVKLGPLSLHHVINHLDPFTGDKAPPAIEFGYSSSTARGPVQSYSDVPIFQRNGRPHLK